MVNVGELVTAVQENANVMIVLMNDQCYGVIRNIQDAQYGGRRMLRRSASAGLRAVLRKLRLDALPHQVARPCRRHHPRRAREDGPVLVEVDMLSVGSFATAFAGPPVKKEDRRSRNMRDAGYAGHHALRSTSR